MFSGGLQIFARTGLGPSKQAGMERILTLRTAQWKRASVARLKMRDLASKQVWKESPCYVQPTGKGQHGKTENAGPKERKEERIALFVITCKIGDEIDADRGGTLSLHLSNATRPGPLYDPQWYTNHASL